VGKTYKDSEKRERKRRGVVEERRPKLDRRRLLAEVIEDEEFEQEELDWFIEEE
jgi:hypothetical protein